MDNRDMHTEIVGKRLKARRKELGLSQTQLAEMADVSKNTVLNLENGENGDRGIDMLTRIAHAMGWQLIDLIGGAEEPSQVSKPAA